MKMTVGFAEFAAVNAVRGASPSAVKFVSNARLGAFGSNKTWVFEGERENFIDLRQDLIEVVKRVSRPRLAMALKEVIKAIEELLDVKTRSFRFRSQDQPPDA